MRPGSGIRACFCTREVTPTAMEDDSPVILNGFPLSSTARLTVAFLAHTVH